MSTTHDILTVARERIARPGGHCRGDHGAWDKQEGAVCAMGALYYAKAKLELAGISLISTVSALTSVLPGDFRFLGVMAYNDTHLQSEIVAIFDAAIAAVAPVVEPEPELERVLVSA